MNPVPMLNAYVICGMSSGIPNGIKNKVYKGHNPVNSLHEDKVIHFNEQLNA